MTELKQEVSLRQLFALGFGSIIGVGWITVLGFWLSGAGAIGAALAFGGGSFIVVLIAFAYAEMATRYPATGGEIVYIHETFGLKPAFAIGWLLLMGYISVVVFEAISVGWIFNALFPVLSGPVLYKVGESDVSLGGLLAGIIGMVVIAGFNIRGAKSAARLQEFITLVLILLMIAFCILAFLRGSPDHWEPYFVFSDTGTIWPGMAALLVTVPFWFGGFDVIPQAMGERAQSASLKGIPLVLIAAILAAAAFYVAIILAASYVLPRAELLNAELPVADAMTAALGSSTGGRLALFAGLLGLISTWNSLFYGATRVLFALGRAKMIYPGFGHVDPRHRTPVRAIVFIAAIGVAGSFFGRSAIIPIVDTAAFAYVTTYAAVSLGAFRLARSQKHALGFQMPGGQLTRSIVVVMSIALAGFAFYQPYAGSDGAIPPQWIVFAVWLAAGLLFYLMGSAHRIKLTASQRSALLLPEPDATKD